MPRLEADLDSNVPPVPYQITSAVIVSRTTPHTWSTKTPANAKEAYLGRHELLLPKHEPHVSYLTADFHGFVQQRASTQAQVSMSRTTVSDMS